MVGAKPDGIWGPLSQKAYDTNKAVFGSSYCDLVPGCTGISPVGPGCDDTPAVVIPKPAPAPGPAPVPSEPLEREGSSTMGLLIGASLLTAAVGAAWMLAKKKKGSR
jgi:hypothetical protein